MAAMPPIDLAQFDRSPAAGDEPVSLTYLCPPSRFSARKEFTRLATAAGERVEVRGYHSGTRVSHWLFQLTDIESLFNQLIAVENSNGFFIRGSVRPDAKSTCNRRMRGADADILDTPSRLLMLDIDGARPPADFDLFDPMAVGDYVREQLPEGLREASCVVQLSNSHGLKPGIIKVHLWFLMDAPLDGPALRRWFNAHNKTSDLQLDAAVATACQPLYNARPLFTGMADPCPRRLALLLGNRDTAQITPPEAGPPRPFLPCPAGEPVRDTGVLTGLAAMIEQATREGLPRHPAILRAAFIAGQYVAGGAVALPEAVAALLPVALNSGSEGADRAVMDSLAAGMASDNPRYASPCIELQATDHENDGVSAGAASAALTKALAAFFTASQSDAPFDLAIKGAAGLGKTTQALALAIDHRAIVDAYVPTHKLAAEQVARLPVGAAVAIRGRTHDEDDLPALCAKSDAAELLQQTGLGPWTQRLLCGKAVANRFPCPHAVGCPYHAQFASNAPIRFYSHEWLTLTVPSAETRAADVALVDENFAHALQEQRHWQWADLVDAGGVFLEIAQAVKAGALSHAAHFLMLSSALGDREAGATTWPDVHPEMDADEAFKVLRRWMEQRKERAQELAGGPGSKSPPIDFLKAALHIVQMGETNRLYFIENDKGAWIFYDNMKPLAAKARAWLFLDASLIEAQVRKIRWEVRVKTIQPRRNAVIVQVSDTALSKNRLENGELLLQNQIGEFINRLAAHNPNGAVIGNKQFMAELTSNGLCPVPHAHDGALRGLNSLENAEWLVRIGRNLPKLTDVERQARCWFASEPDFQAGTAYRAKVRLEALDGATAWPEVTRFKDRYCQMILESIQEQESLQAMDRLRLVHATQPKTIYLLSNLPLPGVRPAALVRLDDLLLPARLASVMNRDAAILGAAELAQRHPDLFDSLKAAEHVINRTFRSVTFSTTPQVPISIFNGTWGVVENATGVTHPISLVNVAYRTARQRGGKSRSAILYATADTAAILTRLHGEAVTLAHRPHPCVADPALNLSPDKPHNPAVAPWLGATAPPRLAPPPNLYPATRIAHSAAEAAKHAPATTHKEITP